MPQPRRAHAVAILLALCALPAQALPPDQIFERVAPNVWALRALHTGSEVLDVGSALALSPGKAVTSCELVARASRIELQRDKVLLQATVEFRDAARDLCQLDVPGLQAQALPRAAPRMGQRLYAIGFERGREMSITEGLFSRLREAGTDAERIQTSAPSTGGLSGAGLFDEEARLLGVVAHAPREPNVIALPARWLDDIAERGRATRAAAAAAAGASFALAPAGAGWSYSYTFRGLGAAWFNFVVRATGVEGATVLESVTIAGSMPQQAAVRADALAFRTFPLPRSQTLIELAPYLHTFFAKDQERLWGTLSGYPQGNAALPAWTILAREMGEEEVTLPAGTFRATRIDVSGRRSAPTGFLAHMAYESSRFQFRAWYVAAVRRYVKVQHETWALNGQWSGEQMIELLSYSEK